MLSNLIVYNLQVALAIKDKWEKSMWIFMQGQRVAKRFNEELTMINFIFAGNFNLYGP